MALRRLFGKRPSAAAQIEDEVAARVGQASNERRPRASEVDESIAHDLSHLRSKLGTETVQEGAVDLVFHPEAWVAKYSAHDDVKHRIVAVALGALATDPPPDLARRIRQRIEYLRQNPDRTLHLPHHLPDYPPLKLTIHDLPPHLDQLLGLLERAAPCDPEAIDLVVDLALHGCGGMSRNVRFGSRYVLFLHSADALSYELFEQIAYANPSWGALLGPTFQRRWLKTTDWPTEHATRLTARLTTLPILSDAEASLLALAEPAPGCLLDAVRLHAEHQLGSFNAPRGFVRHSPQQRAVLALAASGPGDAPDLVEQLRAYPPKSLEPFLPIAPASTRPLASALGYDDAVDLTELIHSYPEVEASADADIGAIDVTTVRLAIDRAGPDLTATVFTLFAKAKCNPNLLKLLQATIGEHGEWIRTSLPKRNQLAVRAMAAAPLDNGIDDGLDNGVDEVRARYDWIQQFRRESSEFGSQRQGSERGAADAAMFNLATNAGYRDVTRLDVAVAASNPIAIPTWTIDDYQVDIAINGGRASTVFRSSDKTLKTAPKAVKQSGDYGDIKQARLDVQAEATRFSHMLQRAMVHDDTFAEAELTSLLRIPIAASVLEGLVVRDSVGITARLSPSGFVGVDGDHVALSGGVTVPHPVELDRRDELGSWQRRLVGDRIVQPFQQVFRAHYPLTPVELEDGFVSARFAGHIIDTGRAAALFGNREWVLSQDEGGEVSKRFASLGLTAVWELHDVGHHLTETVSVGTGGIFFVEGARWYGTDRLPLDQVPPNVFSDVMRDADLVVSVAPGEHLDPGQLRGTGERFSLETLAARRQLVEALVIDLGIPGVTFNDSSAFVTGTLASYRIHLGTGAIYIEPAKHLCVVPEGWRGKKDLFLPFVDDADERISLVVSKILMFSADQKIRDQTILAQISAATSR